MNLFFQIQSLQFLIFCMDDEEFVANLDNVLLCFLLQDHQSFLYCFIILLHLISFSLTRPLHVPYTFVSIESIDCILLSSFELKKIWLTFSVKTLCLSLLSLCCVLTLIYWFSWIVYDFFKTTYVDFIFF